MGHWLDQAARRLASGGISRRELLRGSGAVAGGALLGSVGLPGEAPARSAAGVPCPDFDSPCFPPDICCGDDACITPSARLGCCHGSTYDPSIEHCCATAEPGNGHACFKDESCCGREGCCKRDEVCCNGTCIKPSKRLGCCHGSTYDPHIEDCCHDATAGQGHACFKDEQCCGASECCKHNEECCSSGKLAYCAPNGNCCPHGQHRVQCGKGDSLCCPEGEYCCNGGCAKPDQCCGTGVCGKGQHCCHGKQCCTGPCCKISCCVGKDDQCCHNNNGCCGPKDICCPGGCCIYGCDGAGCSIGPNGEADIPRAPRLR